MDKGLAQKNSGIRGTTLLEVVIYVALFAMVSIIISNFMIQVLNAYNIARAERNVLSNGRLSLETITKTISESQEIYTPTSTFNIDASQLSLITKTEAQPEHTTAYVDFWVDNGRLWMRREGTGSTALSAPTVTVSKFRLERISQGLYRDAVKITLTLTYTTPRYSSSITVNSTTALRGNY